MLAKQIMSQPVAVCQANENLNQAATLMWKADCGVVQIVDSAGRTLAMLTDRDICMAAYTQGKMLQDINVCTAMSKGLIACRPDDSLQKVEERMKNHQLRRIPVLDQDGRPVGILSLNDLVRAANKQHPAAPTGGDGLTLVNSARILAAICAPRLGEGGPRLA